MKLWGKNVLLCCVSEQHQNSGVVSVIPILGQRNWEKLWLPIGLCFRECENLNSKRELRHWSYFKVFATAKFITNQVISLTDNRDLDKTDLILNRKHLIVLFIYFVLLHLYFYGIFIIFSFCVFFSSLDGSGSRHNNCGFVGRWQQVIN